MIPEFDEAIANFREFLDGQWVPNKIVWVAPNDTICCGLRGWKIFQNEGVIESDVIATYRTARKKDFGVRFCVLCADRQASYCYLSVPVDEIDAECKLLANGCVKLSVPEHIPNAEIIQRGFLSSWHQVIESVRFKKWKNIAFRI